MSVPWKLVLALAGASVVALSVAAAEPESDRRAPPFAEQLRSVEDRAPRLRELHARVDAARGQSRQAAAWPNPGLGLEVEDVAGTGAYRGSTQAQTTVSISQPLELGGQRGARAAAGRSSLRLAEAESDLGRLEFAYQLAVAYAEAEAGQSRVGLLQEKLRLSGEDRRATRALVEAGREAELRALQAEAALSAAQAELELVQADFQDALSRLSVLVGSQTPYEAVTPSLLERPVPIAGDDAPDVLDGLPEVRAAVAASDLADRRLSVERRRAIPTPALSAGLRRYNGSDDTAMVFGVSIAVPLFDRNRGGIDAAQAERRAAEARESSARMEAQARLAASRERLRALERRLVAATGAERAAREAYDLARVAYDAGRIPLIEMSMTHRAWTEAQLAVLDARVSRISTAAFLARLTGRLPFVE